jgi:hypothetical protein
MYFFYYFVHINGLFVLNDETAVLLLLLLNDEGISGGGKDEPLVNVTLFDEVN